MVHISSYYLTFVMLYAFLRVGDSCECVVRDLVWWDTTRVSELDEGVL